MAELSQEKQPLDKAAGSLELPPPPRSLQRCSSRCPADAAAIPGLCVHPHRRAGRVSAASGGFQLEHLGERLLGAGVEQEGALGGVERLPVPAAHRGQLVRCHEAFVALPPAQGGQSAPAGGEGTWEGQVPWGCIVPAPCCGSGWDVPHQSFHPCLKTGNNPTHPPCSRVGPGLFLPGAAPTPCPVQYL